MRVLVVGSGVGAAGFLHHAQKLGIHCDHVSSPTNAPVCSLRSTAVAALRGTQMGHSPLGDELVRGWQEAHEFYAQYLGDGVERAVHCTAIFKSEKNLRRFSHLASAPAPLELAQAPQLCVKEEAWIIRPAQFLSAWRAREEFISALTPIEEGVRVRFLDQRDEVYDHVVLATGYWMSWMKDLFSFPSLRPVQGSYFQWDGVDWGSASFSLTIDEDNLVYYATQRTLLLGSTSVKDVTGDFAALSNLQTRYQRVQQLLRRKLPAVEDAQTHTGIRALTKERAPFALNPRPGIHLIGGLYKNGWVMAWRLGRITAERLASH